MIKKSRFLLAIAATMALAFSGIALADGVSENDAFVDGKISPNKLDKKKWKPVHLFAGVRTQHQGGVTGTQPNPASERINFGKNIKFNLKSTPVCQGLPPSGSTPEQAKAACPQSFLGSGAAQVVQPGGSEINDIVVSLFHGGPGNSGSGPAKDNAIMLHTYSPTLGPAAPTVNGEVLNNNELFVEHAPETGSLMITKFNSNVEKSTKAVLARCKSNKQFVFTRTVTYTDGSKEQALLTQKCKRKKKKGHK